MSTLQEFDPVAYTKMVRTFQENDDLLGWFDSIYSDAKGDHRAFCRAGLRELSFLAYDDDQEASVPHFFLGFMVKVNKPMLYYIPILKYL